MKQKLTTIKKGHDGFVILFVVLIAGIILLIGAGIFTISFKENILSSSAKESQLAFSAADSGVECALYHDGLLEFTLATTSIDCVDASLPIQSTSPDVFEFDLPLSNIMNTTGSNLPCAHVVVDKSYFNPSDALDYTWIVSRGYNVCDSHYQPVVTDPLLLERVLDVKYPNPVVGSTSLSVTPTVGNTTTTTGAVPADSISAQRVIAPADSTARRSVSSQIVP